MTRKVKGGKNAAKKMDTQEDIKTKILKRLSKAKNYLFENRDYALITLFLLLLAVIFIIVMLLPAAKKGIRTLYNNAPPSSNNYPARALSPTPTPVPLVQGPQTYSISMKGTPLMYEVWFNTIDPKNGTQTVRLKARDSLGKINLATATVKTDKLSKKYNLSFSAGNASDGEWTGSWLLNDTYNRNFVITFSVADDKGNRASVDLTIR